MGRKKLIATIIGAQRKAVHVFISWLNRLMSLRAEFVGADSQRGHGDIILVWWMEISNAHIAGIGFIGQKCWSADSITFQWRASSGGRIHQNPTQNKTTRQAIMN